MTDPARPSDDPVNPDGPDDDLTEAEMAAPLDELVQLADRPVEPPARFFDDLITRRRRRGLLLIGAGVAVSAAVWAAVVAATSGVVGDAEPDVDALVERHEQVVAEAEATGRSATEQAGVESFQPMAGEDMPAPYQAPEELAGALTVSSGFYSASSGVAHLVYEQGRRVISVFELPGELSTDGLDEMQELSMDGERAWEHEAPPFRAIVLRRDDLVYVVVGEAERDEMAGAMGDLPGARPMGLSHRLRDAMEDLVATFAFE